jgi:hypothetical protein
MRWAGMWQQGRGEKKVCRVLVGKPEGKTPLGRPRRRWENGIRMDIWRSYSREDISAPYERVCIVVTNVSKKHTVCILVFTFRDWIFRYAVICITSNSPPTSCTTYGFQKRLTIFTLKMTTAMVAEKMDNLQHSTRLIHNSGSCT